MPSTYQGAASNVSNSLTATVSTTTGNAVSPIVVTTTAAHGFQTGDLVNVGGVTGNTAANSNTNSPWTITVLSTTTFSLNGSTGNGAYVSGGTATDASLTPATQIPSDGDPRNAAATNVAAQLTLDRTQFNALRLGKYRLLNQYAYSASDGGGGEDNSSSYVYNTSWSATTTGTTGVWTACTNCNPSVGSTTCVLFGTGVGAQVSPPPSVNQGDVLDIYWSTSGFTSGAAAAGLIATFASFSNISSGAATRVPGSEIWVPASSNNGVPAISRATYVVPSGGNNQTFALSVYTRTMNNGQALTLNLTGARTYVVSHYRAN